ncbi:hypothetical protein [Hyphomicrobium sp.]|uniref:hypothetical protein n=1 Tax=Hyphomicrobium sp. TaxID=82 RepID=UPI0025C24261|nr:hypothetical protein [Hyphomicrobium sp.]MCC7250532.1 hypothetical protein [Hyphomicrobium sp.]
MAGRVSLRRSTTKPTPRQLSFEINDGMQVDDDTWAAVRRAYADASVPLAEIAKRFGVTPMRIGARAKREGWAGREERAGKTKGGAAKAGKSPAPVTPLSKRSRRDALPTRGAQASLIGRLYRAISLKLEHMEKRMASGEVRSAQDEERESRALATLISNFEKVTEAVAGLDENRDAARTAGAGADAERMRREIAERLERLGSGGTPKPRSRKPRS